MTRFSYFLPVLFLGCATTTTDDASDSEAETATAQSLGKADATSFAGVYRAHTTALKDGDVPSVELLEHGMTNTYVRSRCYHASCSLRIPETDTYDIYTASSGKTYIRFWSFTITSGPNRDLTEHPVVADVYEIKAISHGIKLRKSLSARWQTLYLASASQLCVESHGTWASNACTCAGNVPGLSGPHEFISGAGGCIETPGASESNCDASGGMWTDDEQTLIGSYCECGRGRYDDASGSCAAI